MRECGECECVCVCKFYWWKIDEHITSTAVMHPIASTSFASFNLLSSSSAMCRQN